MEPDHFLTFGEAVFLVALYSAPSILAGAALQFLMLRRCLTPRRAAVAAAALATTTLALGLAAHRLLGAHDRSMAFGVPGLPTLVLAAAITLAVWRFSTARSRHPR